jgi:type II secretory pathway pseudopilin PulG
MTIIELVIVVMVMSIMAAVAMPAFLDSLLFHRVESAARRVKADMKLARHTARLTSAAQSITFTNSTYTLSAAVKSLDDPNDTYHVDLAAAPFEIGSVTADFNGGQTVSFDGYGKPATGGTVVLATQGHRCTITLNATTGDVTIASSHGN